MIIPESHPSSREYLAAAALMAFLLFLAYGPAKLDGHLIYGGVIQDVTNLYGFFAWDEFSGAEFSEGRVPLWNPHNAFGVPHLANMQTAIFYPLNWLKFGLGFFRVIDALLLIRLFIAGFFAFVFARRCLGASFFPSAIAGTAFMMSGYLTRYVYMSHLNVETMLPLVMVITHLLAERASVGRLLGVAFGFALLVTGGFPESALHGLVFCLAYYLTVAGIRPAGILALGAACCLGLILSLPQWLPFAEYYANAWTYHDPSAGSRHLDPLLMVSLWVPWFFGDNRISPAVPFLAPYLGVVPMVMALAGISSAGRRGRQGIFFAAAAFALFALVYGAPPLSLLGKVFPFSVTYNDKYAMPVLSLAIAMLAALGGEDLLAHKKTGPLLVSGILTLVLIAVCVWLGLPPRHWFSPFYALGLLKPMYIIVASVLVVLVLAAAWLYSSGKLTARVVGVAFFLLASYGLLYDHQGHRPVWNDDLGRVAPGLLARMPESSGDYRIQVDTQIKTLRADRLLPLGFDDLRSYDPLYPRDYVRFMEAVNGLDGDNLIDHYNRNMLFTVEQENIDNPLLDLANVFLYILPARPNEYALGPHFMETARTVSPRRESWLRWDEFYSGEKSRMALMEHAPVRVDAELQGEEFIFEPAAPDPFSGQTGDGVNLLVLLTKAASGFRPELAYARYLAPSAQASDRGFQTHVARLPATQSRSAFIILPGPKGDDRNDSAMLGMPRVRRGDVPGHLREVEGPPGLFLYTDSRARPRVTWVSKIGPAPEGLDFMEAVDRVAKASPKTFREVVVVPGNVSAGADSLPVEVEPREPVQISRVPGRVEIAGARENGGFLVVADQRFPGFKAMVESGGSKKEVPIFPANGPFMAVPVPPGPYRATLVYRPWSFAIGLYAGGGGLVACGLALTASRLKRRTG